jgi:dihydroorotase (multifunctional complex type)
MTITGSFILRGGRLVAATGIQAADIAIQGEQIAAVGPDLAAEMHDVPVIDVGGLAIFPGLIDVHVHLREPGGEHKEDFYTGTRAALAGGVTTVLGMPNTSPPITNAASLDDALSRASHKAMCDYGLYIGGTSDNATEAAALRQAVGLKLYVGSSTGSLLVDQVEAQIAHFESYPKDRVIAIHAEDEAAVRFYAARGQRRPPMCAALATAHVLVLAEQIGCRIHICHVSTGYELDLIHAARQRGLSVTCEVAPHHLFLSTDDEAALGALGRVNPPLRSRAEVEALWQHKDVIDMIATDHAPHTLAEKRSDAPPSGMPGLETMLPLLLTAAHEGRISVPDIARWTASRPAEVFGLSHKGRIAPGNHADLTLVDLNEQWTVSDERLLTRCGWTPFAGKTVRGRVVRVYLRGELVYQDGEILARPGQGRQVEQETLIPNT